MLKSKINKKIVIFFLMILLLLNLNINSYCINDGTSRFGEAIYIDNNDSISLTKENIHIEVATGDVTNVYNLKNISKQSKNITMKFPGKITYRTENEIRQIDIKNINVYVNKEKVIIDKEKFFDSEYDYWYVWNTDFKVDEEKEIIVTYESIWEKDYLEGVTVGFIRTKGGPWIGELGYSKITFDFKNLKEYYVINSLDKSVYKKVDDKYIWEAKEYVPNEDLLFYMKPKLLHSDTLNISYYDNKQALKDKKILIETDINYTNTREEKEIKEKVSNDLKIKLQESGADVCTSLDIDKFLTRHGGQVKFDYIITLICDKDNNISKSKPYIAYEKVEKGNEEKYRRTVEIVDNILNCGLDGVGNIFLNIKVNDVTEENLLDNKGTISIDEAYDYESPRIILSLGYITDLNKSYLECDEIVEKIRLGLSIYEENLNEEEIEKELEVEEEIYNKRSEDKKYKGVLNFLRYNLLTIFISFICGAIIGITIFSLIILGQQKKNRERYAMWYKKIK